MADVEITRMGVTKAEHAIAEPYGEVHISDLIDVWLPNTTVGVDHLFYEDGTVELRVMGDRLESLP
jgi:hypothetical protein